MCFSAVSKVTWIKQTRSCELLLRRSGKGPVWNSWIKWCLPQVVSCHYTCTHTKNISQGRFLSPVSLRSEFFPFFKWLFLMICSSVAPKFLFFSILKTDVSEHQTKVCLFINQTILLDRRHTDLNSNIWLKYSSSFIIIIRHFHLKQAKK